MFGGHELFEGRVEVSKNGNQIVCLISDGAFVVKI